MGLQEVTNAKHGPALAFDPLTGQFALSWVDAQNRIHVAYSADGVRWVGEIVLPGESSRGNCGTLLSVWATSVLARLDRPGLRVKPVGDRV